MLLSRPRGRWPTGSNRLTTRSLVCRQEVFTSFNGANNGREEEHQGQRPSPQGAEQQQVVDGQGWPQVSQAEGQLSRRQYRFRQRGNRSPTANFSEDVCPTIPRMSAIFPKRRSRMRRLIRSRVGVPPPAPSALADGTRGGLTGRPCAFRSPWSFAITVTEPPHERSQEIQQVVRRGSGPH